MKTIEDMAREADFMASGEYPSGVTVWRATTADLNCFAALVRAQALDEAYAATFDAVLKDGHFSERAKLLAFDVTSRIRELKART